MLTTLNMIFSDEQPIKKLKELNIPKTNIKNLMKIIHKNTITYLTYLVLN